MRFLFTLLLVATSITSTLLQAQINFNAAADVYNQNFNSLNSTGTDNPFNLSGWSANRAEYRANNGGANAGALYAFGDDGNAERALGSITSVSQPFIVHGFKLNNNTGETVTSINVQFRGEMWRKGGRVLAGGIPVPDTLYFDYSTAAGTIDDSTVSWTLVPALFFISPDTTGAVGARPGNESRYQTAVNGSITITLPSGSGVWLRWNNTRFPSDPVFGAKDALAIDDLRVSVVTDGDPPVCERPVSPAEQAQNLNLSISNDSLFVSFNPGTPVSGYLVTISSALAPADPTDGTTYNVGDELTASGKASVVIGAGTGTNVIFAPLENGKTYTVRVYSYNQCAQILYGVFTEKQITYNAPTFVKDRFQGPSFNLFPNPAHGSSTLNIRFEETVSGIGEWQIFNTTGSLVAANRVGFSEQMALPLPNLKAGHYILMLHQNGKYSTAPFVVGQ